jgi:hypothetical protein
VYTVAFLLWVHKVQIESSHGGDARQAEHILAELILDPTVAILV